MRLEKRRTYLLLNEFEYKEYNNMCHLKNINQVALGNILEANTNEIIQSNNNNTYILYYVDNCLYDLRLTFISILILLKMCTTVGALECCNPTSWTRHFE